VKAVAWIETNKPVDEEVRAFRAEAEGLMVKGFGRTGCN
jgi:hypothetical protein